MFLPHITNPNASPNINAFLVRPKQRIEVPVVPLVSAFLPDKRRQSPICFYLGALQILVRVL
jgi:hypothetical protein